VIRIYATYCLNHQVSSTTRNSWGPVRTHSCLPQRKLTSRYLGLNRLDMGPAPIIGLRAMMIQK